VSWVALALAVMGGEVGTDWACFVIHSWVLAEAFAFLSVEVEAEAALLRFAQAVTSFSVEVVSVVFTSGVHALALA